MSHRPVDGQFRADAHADHHEADLVDFAIAEDTTQVVLNNGVKDGEKGHEATYEQEDVGSGKEAGQHADGALRGKGAKKYRTRGSSLGVAVRQPNVQAGKSGLDADSEEDERRS